MSLSLILAHVVLLPTGLCVATLDTENLMNAFQIGSKLNRTTSTNPLSSVSNGYALKLYRSATG